eukprot:3836765-Pyramimonas_sp.AAC.2
MVTRGLERPPGPSVDRVRIRVRGTRGTRQSHPIAAEVRPTSPRYSIGGTLIINTGFPAVDLL